ncbi:MAG TPA: hypothetical protein VFY10_01535 [Dehalococcoidia bacterium]|nr:hypothetical protein [Dehalococcoidia bacterium]
MLPKTSIALRYLLPLIGTVAILGGIIGGLVVYVATKDNGSGLMRGGIVKLGPPSSLGSNPFCIEAQHFCIVQLDHGIVALYTYDTHPYFRSEDCSVKWLPDFEFTDPDTGQQSKGWFRSGCSGATFKINGELVFGPAPRNLDQFRLTVHTGSNPALSYIEVDTSHLFCGQSHDGSDAQTCDFAPLPQ